MLVHLSIRNIVLIEKLDLEFNSGLTVLTGETGAGKSILLDALGLALGSRADFSLVRHGHTSAQISASFVIPSEHPVRDLLIDAGIPMQEELILKRQLRQDRSPATINDEPVSVSLLRRCGDLLVEIQGQFEGRGLLDTSTHLTLLDRISGHAHLVANTQEAFQRWHQSEQNYNDAEATFIKARAEEDWLRESLKELDMLSPVAGEEEALMTERNIHANANKIIQGLHSAHELLSYEDGAVSKLGSASAHLDKIENIAISLLNPIIEKLQQITFELNEVETELRDAAENLDADPRRLEEIDERLHLLRSLARKHNCSADKLPDLYDSFQKKITLLDDATDNIAQLRLQRDNAYRQYVERARNLSASRITAAHSLDQHVMQQLPVLKLESSEFRTNIQLLDEDRWGANGIDKVRFEARTNIGQSIGDIHKIASGGELARFLLALKVVLSEGEPDKCLIFDEVDSGVGGAVADAVGSRLSALGKKTQTLVITHSPQVAAKGQNHLKISKMSVGNKIISNTTLLDADGHREEVARMLAGEKITDAARMAARTLIDAQG